jgi:peroxiredoxin
MLGLVACNKDRVKITGSISNAENVLLHLDEVDVYQTNPADSAVLTAKGKFSFRFNAGEPCFYQLRLSDDKIIVLFPEPGQHIRVTADAANLTPSVSIEGSHATEQVTKLVKALYEAKVELDSITREYNRAETDTVRIRLDKAYQDVLESHRKFSIAFILTHYNSLASLYALYQQYQPGSYVFYKGTDMQFFRIVSDSLVKYYPGSKHVKALVAYTDNMIGNYRSQAILQSAQVNEASLPEVALPDMKGDTIDLRSLKGKVVLLSFWAANCKTCVAQNLELKKIYGLYKNRGFEVMQVSFDNNEEIWKQAVRYDELPWISLIDTKYPNSVVAGNFNISEIPANYLIAKDNVTILGKNLTPAQIMDKLQDIQP